MAIKNISAFLTGNAPFLNIRNRKVNLVIEQGAPYTANLSVLDATGTVFDLTNYSITGNMALSFFSDDNALDIPVTILSPTTNGIINISFDATDTAGLKAENYVFNIDISGPANYRIFSGTIIVNPGVNL